VTVLATLVVFGLTDLEFVVLAGSGCSGISWGSGRISSRSVGLRLLVVVLVTVFTAFVVLGLTSLDLVELTSGRCGWVCGCRIGGGGIGRSLSGLLVVVLVAVLAASVVLLGLTDLEFIEVTSLEIGGDLDWGSNNRCESSSDEEKGSSSFHVNHCGFNKR